MIKILSIFLSLVLVASISGCASKSDEQNVLKNKNIEKKNTQTEQNDKANNELALTFLHGLQDGNKEKMYVATNMTIDQGIKSRDKLIYASKNKLTDSERKECENALRISGQIDFFVSKIRKLFPKSANYQITKTIKKESKDNNNNYEHFITITYSNKNEAIVDKSSKAVKEMTVHLQQIEHTLDGKLIREFSFESKDFDKMADRDFEVVSYF